MIARHREERDSEELLPHHVYYDRLTALPNRELFVERLRRTLVQAQAQKRIVGVLLIDLDGCEGARALIGHTVCDAMLVEVARHLRNGVRGQDTVARLDSSRLAVLLPVLADPDEAGKLAEKILHRFESLFAIGGHRCRITAGIGISVHPDDGGDVETLLAKADAAACLSRKDGRNAYCYFRQAFEGKSCSRLFSAPRDKGR